MWKGVRGKYFFDEDAPLFEFFYIYLQHKEISGISSQRVFDYKKVNW